MSDDNDGPARDADNPGNATDGDATRRACASEVLDVIMDGDGHWVFLYYEPGTTTDAFAYVVSSRREVEYIIDGAFRRYRQDRDDAARGLTWDDDEEGGE